MSKFPYLPLCVDAYRNDTAHLTLEQHGAYLTLIMLAWRTPDCRLPDDDAKLARMLGVTSKKWASLKPAVMEFWALVDGFWTQKRLEKERDFVSRRAKTSSDNGSHGGRPKSLISKDWANPAGLTQDTQAEPASKAPNTLHLTQDTKDKAVVEQVEPHSEKTETHNGADASRSARGKTRYFLEAGVIRLNEPDYRRWEAAYPNLNLRGELMALARWAGEQDNWFFAVPGALAKRDREAKLAIEKIKAEAIAMANAPARPKVKYLGP